MFFPSKYDEHNDSLERFVEIFNNFSSSNNMQIYIKINKIENFKNDGVIVNEKNNKTIKFDWEKRNKYYYNCGFPFETFGQFERKIKKDISLSIQCCKSEKCFCVAWHKDFRNEEKIHLGSKTESGRKEFSGKRFTKDFKEFKYVDMLNFLKMIEYSFENDFSDKRSFNWKSS